MKNNIQRGIIVLIIAMLIAIPNLRVYSFVGNYKTSSSAITANNYYRKYSTRVEKPSVLVTGMGSLAIVASAISVAFILSGTIAVAVANAIMDDGIQPNDSIIKNDQNYAKYDFSQFDN